MLKIMLLDDDQNMKDLLKFYLKRVDLEDNITQFTTIGEAEKALASTKFDLWIIDHRLRGTRSGLQFVKERNSFTPFIYSSFYLDNTLSRTVKDLCGVPLDKNMLLKNPQSIKEVIEKALNKDVICA